MNRLLSLFAPHSLLVILSTIFIVGFSVLPSTSFSADYPYRDELLERARLNKLHEARTWEVLLHYTRNMTGGYRSRIDDPRFFISPDGHTDSEAELAANVSCMFEPDAVDGEHCACRFPARFDWLTSSLGIDQLRLPQYTCSERDRNLNAVEAKSAVLVFPVGHVNSPASMFGHTLIRIDGSSRSNLISHAVNYAATATDTNGFLYAWKGLTGMYKGYYSLMPYYVKVKEYNDLEHRDIWEYRLTLTEEEVGKMLKHIWELHNIHSSYYFLDENCSYNLLFLIEAARPELRLTDQTGFFVLPTHTIRIAQESGILEPPLYRPSQGTRIKLMLSKLDSASRMIAHGLAHGAPVSRAGDEGSTVSILRLDLAAEFVQFRYGRQELPKDDFNRLYLSLLKERSSLGAAPDGLYEITEPSRPETGHDTTKVAAGAGLRRGKVFAQLEIQPEFHTLMDPDQGYLRGAQIKFLDTVIRYTIPMSEVRLESLHVIDIFSVTPRDIFFKPLSWKVNLGLDNELMRNGMDSLVFRLTTGGGLAYASPFDGIWYGIAEFDLNIGEGVRAGATIAPGLNVGGLEKVTDWWKVHLAARGLLYQLGDDRRYLKLSLAQNFRFSHNNSLTLEFFREFVNRHHVDEAQFLWNYYF